MLVERSQQLTTPVDGASTRAVAAVPELAMPAEPVVGFRLLPVDPERARRAELVYQALRHGDAPISSHRPFPGLTSNVPTIADVHFPTVGTITAVVKPPAELAAQEAFVFDIARRLGISHHYAQIAPRADGTTLIEVVDGKTWKQAGIKDIHDLDAAFLRAWEHHHPNMPAAERVQRARVDRELVQFVDWLTAQGDRSPNNGLFDDRRVAVQLFDHGRIGFETPWKPTQPWLPYDYMGHDMTGRVRHMELSEESKRIIAANLSVEDIRASHLLLRNASHEGMPKGQDVMLRFLGSDRFLDRMVARRMTALTSGRMEYVGGGLRTKAMYAIHAMNRVIGRH